MRPDQPRRLGSVLVANDGSPGAARAQRRAALLPYGERATIHFVHVMAPAASDASTGEAAKDLERRVTAARDALQRAGRGDVDVVCAVLEGAPTAEELIRYARVQGAELIVLGRHGREARGEPSMGSTAFQLVRQADLPLLVVAADAVAVYARPMLAVELTDTAGQVVDLARALLPSPGPTLELVHALRVPFEGTLSWALSKGAADKAKRQARAEAQARADRFVTSLAPVRASAEVLATDHEPSTAIVAEAARRAADLLVVGTHGRSGLSHAVFGSVAEWLVASAACDVAITRPARHTFELK